MSKNNERLKRQTERWRARRAKRHHRPNGASPLPPVVRGDQGQQPRIFGYWTTPEDTAKDVKRIADAGGEFLLAIRRDVVARILLSTVDVREHPDPDAGYVPTDAMLVAAVRDAWNANLAEIVSSLGWDAQTGLRFTGGDSGVSYPTQ